VARNDVSIVWQVMWQADRTDDVLDDVAYGSDVSVSGWLTSSNRMSTHGSLLESNWVPRGPIMGCHVAPQF
jgi:hypothetical protein